MIRKILIVDDSPVARAIVKKCLPADRDFLLAEAGNGLEGLEKYREEHPDLTLLDLTMPVMDGFAALEAIRREDPEALVVVLSSDIQPKTIERVKSLGAALVLPKPPSAESLRETLATVSRLLGS